jgi:type IV pilus assembly protein PilE
MLFKKNQGFTLTELLITLAILGLLASIAIPSYTKQIRKTRRADAQAALLELSQRQETFYSDWNSYTMTIVSLGWGNGNVSKEGYYDLAITAANARTFTATATAKGTQAEDTDCSVFQITNTGEKTSTNSGGTASTECW